MNKKKSGTEKLKVKITICLLIAIAVLVINKIDGHEENRVVSAVMDYYSRDYSVEVVAAAMSEGLDRAEKLPGMVKKAAASPEENGKEDEESAEARQEQPEEKSEKSSEKSDEEMSDFSGISDISGTTDAEQEPSGQEG